MNARYFAPILALWAISQAGCATAPQATHRDFLVPSTALINTRHDITHPCQILPGSDAEIWIARGQREALGATTLGGFSAFTLYTADRQAIHIPSAGTGYRHRWVVQHGLSVPAGP